MIRSGRGNRVLVVIKPEEIAWRRLAGQFLTVPGPAKPADVVRRLGAVQAQDYAGAKWALAQRTKAATDAAVDRAVDAGTIVRTHVLRPTWHFVAACDLRWMLALTGPRISRALASYNRVLEITPAVIHRSHAAITKALEGGRHLTRAEVAAVLSRAKVGALTGHRFGRLVVQAELDAIICSGARRGKQSTYALLDERVTAARGFERDTALAELARRYFPTRGPASAHDFAWWSGLTVADARRAVAILGRELEPIDVGGRPFWMSAGAKAPPRKPCAHLLPNYDEYFIGFVDRSAIGRAARQRGAGDRRQRAPQSHRDRERPDRRGVEAHGRRAAGHAPLRPAHSPVPRRAGTPRPRDRALPRVRRKAGRRHGMARVTPTSL